MKRFIKMYKKVIMISVLCITMGTSLFFTDRNVMTTYAYTEEEKAAAKAWLSQNGYPPTMDGAQQAYQDYLNGKFGSVDGGGTPGDSESQTPDETNNGTGETTPPDSQEGNSEAEAKTEEKNDSSDSETETEKKEGDTGSEKKETTQKSGSGSEEKEATQKDGSGSEKKETTQKSGSGSEKKEATQKGSYVSRTKKEEKAASSDSKTKAALQKEKSDAESNTVKSDIDTKLAENKQSGNKNAETGSEGLLASGDGNTENLKGSDVGIGAENPEDSDVSIGDGNSVDSAVNSKIIAGELSDVKRNGINVILIITIIGAIVLIYFIRHFYIGYKREKSQRQ